MISTKYPPYAAAKQRFGEHGVDVARPQLPRGHADQEQRQDSKRRYPLNSADVFAPLHRRFAPVREASSAPRRDRCSGTRTDDPPGDRRQARKSQPPESTTLDAASEQSPSPMKDVSGTDSIEDRQIEFGIERAWKPLEDAGANFICAGDGRKLRANHDEGERTHRYLQRPGASPME